MARKLTEVEGIGTSFASKLQSAGCKSTDDLLEACGAPKGRKAMAEKTGISEKMLLRWTNMADLFRVKGIGEEYADLLEAAGVDTVPELARRNAASLREKMVAINEKKKLTRQVPAESQVAAWVAAAQSLPRIVTH